MELEYTIKNDNYFIEKICADADYIIESMKDTDYEAFTQDIRLQDSMMFRLIQISENTKFLSNKYKEKKKDIAWTDISGLRNRIVHDYGNIDLKVVFDTLNSDIVDLRGKLNADS